jgi:hypothetical protein
MNYGSLVIYGDHIVGKFPVISQRAIKLGEMEYDILDGDWTDTGTFESSQIANQMLLNCDNERIK